MNDLKLHLCGTGKDKGQESDVMALVYFSLCGWEQIKKVKWIGTIVGGISERSVTSVDITTSYGSFYLTCMQGVRCVSRRR